MSATKWDNMPDDDAALSSEGDSESLHSRDTDYSDEDADDDGEETVEITPEHYQAIRATVIDISTALGGLEETTDDTTGEVKKVYVIGDECLRCLRDLRTLLHQDEDDTGRVVPIIFSEVNVVQRGLIPLLLKAVEMGERGSKIALACTDLLTSLTWPIDLSAEQQAAFARDSDRSPLESYQRMQSILISYKAAFLKLRSAETCGSRRSVLNVIMLHILLPALSKPRHRRHERDVGTISMCLHLFRNLLAIRDPVATSLSSADVIEKSNLQNDLLVELKETHILDTLLMLANNADARDFEPWNIVTAECVYYTYAGTLPEQLVEQTKSATSSSSLQSSLSLSLAEEKRQKSIDVLTSGTSRHSRYSTTISFKDDQGSLRVARTQRALRKTADQLTTLHREKSKRMFRRKKIIDEKGAARTRRAWSPAALSVVSAWAESFVKMGLESLVRSVVKDVRSESAKAGNIAETRTRIMRVSQFFLEYFLHCNAAAENALGKSFDLVEFWLEPWALKMAWMRANVAREDKAWLEFVTAVQLWTTLLRLVDALAHSGDQRHRDMAEGIHATHFYDELALDAAKSVIKAYTNQSFRCLETLIEFAYVMPRALERYSKNKENLYIKTKRLQKKGNGEESSEEQIKQFVESQIRERKFEFEKFQSHLCSQQLVEACFTYLLRYQEIDVNRAEERIGNVVNVLHRMAVKADNIRLFYPYGRRVALKKIKEDHTFWLHVQARAPKVETDLTKLIKFALTKFDKLDDEEKDRWGEGMKAPKPVKVFKMSSEIELIPGAVPDAERVRLAVTLLVREDMLSSIVWVKSGVEEAIRRVGEDVTLEYHDDGMMREWASKNPTLKMFCRLLGMKSDENDDHCWRWTITGEKSVEEHEQTIDDIEDALITPFPAHGLLQPLTRRKRKQAPRVVLNEFGDEEEVYVPRGRNARKARQFIDDDLIEDSDEEIEAAERMLAAQRSSSAAEDVSPLRRRSGSSDSSSRSTSVTASSVHGSAVEFRKRELFLGSDDDDSDEEADDEANSVIRKRTDLSDDEDIASLPKRRIIIDDDDE